jgi:hypothetical protein
MWFVLALACAPSSPPPEKPRRAAQVDTGVGEPEQGLWNRARDAKAKAKAASDEIERLEALGYVGGSELATARTNVTVSTPQAWPGVNLALTGHAAEASLIAMDGTVLHTWRKPWSEAFPGGKRHANKHGVEFWRKAHLLPDGRLLAIFEGHGLVALDRDSNVLWTWDGRPHHDLEVLPDGRIWVLAREGKVIERLAPRPAGARGLRRPALARRRGAPADQPARSHGSRPVRAASSTRSPRSSATSSTPTASPCSTARRCRPHPAFAAGNLLISMRTPSAIAVLDPTSQEPGLVADGRLGQTARREDPVRRLADAVRQLRARQTLGRAGVRHSHHEADLDLERHRGDAVLLAVPRGGRALAERQYADRRERLRPRLRAHAVRGSSPGSTTTPTGPATSGNSWRSYPIWCGCRPTTQAGSHLVRDLRRRTSRRARVALAGGKRNWTWHGVPMPTRTSRPSHHVGVNFAHRRKREDPAALAWLIVGVVTWRQGLDQGGRAADAKFDPAWCRRCEVRPGMVSPSGVEVRRPPDLGQRRPRYAVPGGRRHDPGHRARRRLRSGSPCCVHPRWRRVRARRDRGRVFVAEDRDLRNVASVRVDAPDASLSGEATLHRAVAQWNESVVCGHMVLDPAPYGFDARIPRRPDRWCVRASGCQLRAPPGLAAAGAGAPARRHAARVAPWPVRARAMDEGVERPHPVPGLSSRCGDSGRNPAKLTTLRELMARSEPSTVVHRGKWDKGGYSVTARPSSRCTAGPTPGCLRPTEDPRYPRRGGCASWPGGLEPNERGHACRVRRLTSFQGSAGRDPR